MILLMIRTISGHLSCWRDDLGLMTWLALQVTRSHQTLRPVNARTRMMDAVSILCGLASTHVDQVKARLSRDGGSILLYRPWEYNFVASRRFEAYANEGERSVRSRKLSQIYRIYRSSSIVHISKSWRLISIDRPTPAPCRKS